MNKRIVRQVLGFCGILICINCGKSAADEDIPVQQTDRVLKFSGMDWIVRNNDVKQGPGPNFFSNDEDNVFIDADGKLHLKITQRGGNWYCAGIYAKQALGYGTYTFYVHSDIQNLDQHVVAGLFTYLNDNEEIDIEFSKWSQPDNDNAQFAIQPSDKAGNKLRFHIPENAGPTKHHFEWREGEVGFESSSNTANPKTFATWKYTGLSIPKASNERLRLNLWLNKGEIPSDFKEQEIIIDSVSFKQ